MAADVGMVILKLLLEHEELYGLQLVEKSGGLIRRGSVYVTLSRLEEQGLVKAIVKDTPKGSQGPPRRSYQITGEGRRVYRDFENALLAKVQYFAWEGTK